MMPAQLAAKKFTIPSDLSAARVVQAAIETDLQNTKFSDKEVYAIKLALEEALVNAIKHGNKLDPNKTVHIQYCVAPERFEIHIKDEGAGFDPDSIPDPTALENLERPCGRGLLLMRHYMTEISYADSGRTLRMFKSCNGAK